MSTTSYENLIAQATHLIEIFEGNSHISEETDEKKRKQQIESREKMLVVVFDELDVLRMHLIRMDNDFIRKNLLAKFEFLESLEKEYKKISKEFDRLMSEQATLTQDGIDKILQMQRDIEFIEKMLDDAIKILDENIGIIKSQIKSLQIEIKELKKQEKACIKELINGIYSLKSQVESGDHFSNPKVKSFICDRLQDIAIRVEEGRLLPSKVKSEIKDIYSKASQMLGEIADDAKRAKDIGEQLANRAVEIIGLDKILQTLGQLSARRMICEAQKDQLDIKLQVAIDKKDQLSNNREDIKMRNEKIQALNLSPAKMSESNNLRGMQKRMKESFDALNSESKEVDLQVANTQAYRAVAKENLKVVRDTRTIEKKKSPDDEVELHHNGMRK